MAETRLLVDLSAGSGERASGVAMVTKRSTAARCQLLDTCFDDTVGKIVRP